MIAIILITTVEALGLELGQALVLQDLDRVGVGGEGGKFARHRCKGGRRPL